jgi:hypothetical protein
MASNVLTAVMPKILAQGLMVLRENAIAARLVNSMSSQIAGVQGSTIDVPIPSLISAVDVVPAATAPDAGALTPTTIPVTLDKWKEAAFDLNDNEVNQVMNGLVPMQAEAAIRAIVQAVDNDILSQYKKFYGTFGDAGTTPFGASGSAAGVTGAVGIRKVLEKQLAPKSPRHVLLDPDAEANALALTHFADMNFSGSVDAMRDGLLNTKLGMSWWMNQNIPTHTSPAMSAGAATVNGVNNPVAVGTTQTLSIAKATNATNLIVGDIIVIGSGAAAGSYVVLANVTLAVGNTSVSIYPALRGATAGGETITKINTHVANLAFHRDAIAFANRPLMSVPEGLGALSMSQMDPISGLALRVEVTRQHKRTRWSYDFLWGTACPRPELGARLLG